MSQLIMYFTASLMAQGYFYVHPHMDSHTVHVLIKGPAIEQ